MTGRSPDRLRRGAGIRAGLACLVLAAAPGCDSPSPTFPADVPGYGDNPPPQLATLGDERVTVECRTASVTIRENLHIDPLLEHLGRDWGACTSTYLLDFSVESDAGEAMLLDFLRPYELYDWKVHTGGGRVRHDFRVVWQPYYGYAREQDWSLGWRPLTIPVCPEGERGPVLACWDNSCGLYDREDQVSAVVPDTLGIEFSTPGGYENVQHLYEGETLEIPLTYVVHRDENHRSGPYKFLIHSRFLVIADSSPPRTPYPHTPAEGAAVVEISPQRIELGGLRNGDSDTIVWRLHAKPNDVEQTPSLVLITFRYDGVLPGGCEAGPNNVQVWIHDRP